MHSNICHHCTMPFDTKRSDAVYCSQACRQSAYRERKEETDTEAEQEPAASRFSLLPMPHTESPDQEEEDQQQPMLPEVVEDVPFEEVEEPTQIDQAEPSDLERVPPLVRAGTDPDSPWFNPDPLVDYNDFAVGWIGEAGINAAKFNRHLQGWLDALFELERKGEVELSEVKALLQRIQRERARLTFYLHPEYPYGTWADDRLIPRIKRFVVTCTVEGWEDVWIQLEERFRAEALEVLYVVSEV